MTNTPKRKQGTITRRVERRVSAEREVTVRLHGWPAEERMLSSIEACWMVSLEFLIPSKTEGGHNVTMSHTVFESDDYGEAFQKYEAFKKIAEG